MTLVAERKVSVSINTNKTIMKYDSFFIYLLLLQSYDFELVRAVAVARLVGVWLYREETPNRKGGVLSGAR